MNLRQKLKKSKKENQTLKNLYELLKPKSALNLYAETKLENVRFKCLVAANEIIFNKHLNEQEWKWLILSKFFSDDAFCNMIYNNIKEVNRFTDDRGIIYSQYEFNMWKQKDEKAGFNRD